MRGLQAGEHSDTGLTLVFGGTRCAAGCGAWAGDRAPLSAGRTLAQWESAGGSARQHGSVRVPVVWEALGTARAAVLCPCLLLWSSSIGVGVGQASASPGLFS